MTAFKRPNNPNTAGFDRWLVMLDIMPDVGELSGFQQIKLPRRTINVVERRELSSALTTIRTMGTKLRDLQVEKAWTNSVFRYGFCLIDMTKRTAINGPQIQEWARETSTKQSTDTPGEAAHERDILKAASIARSITQRLIPQVTLLDAQDPLSILRSKSLLPSGPIIIGVRPDSPYAGVVSPSELDAAVDAQNHAGKKAWAFGLDTLPDLIDASLERVLTGQSQAMMNKLQYDGLPINNPRVYLARDFMARKLTNVRFNLSASIYRDVIMNRINYSDTAELDLVTLADWQRFIPPPSAYNSSGGIVPTPRIPIVIPVRPDTVGIQ